MRTVYCEIAQEKNCAVVRCRSVRQHAAEIARRRRMARIREAVGGAVGMAGFLLLLCVGGAEDLTTIIAGGFGGLALMVFGGWLGRAFYGQERDAEWLRRLREHGNDC